MTSNAISPADPLLSSRAVSRLLTAGTLCAVIDALWAMALAMNAGRPPLGVWAGVAAVALGPSLKLSGASALLTGLAVHTTVAFSWSALFLLIESRWTALQRALRSPRGLLLASAVYGPFVWIMMSTVLIPLRTGNAPNISGRWVLQLCAHALFVGLPIVWGARR